MANSGKKSLMAGAILCFALSAGVLGYWQSVGGAMVTQYQVAVTVSEEDEFGDVIERTEMQDQFQFGLLPDKGYDAALPWVVGFDLIGVALLIMYLRSRR
jgi:hypothetical protein